MTALSDLYLHSSGRIGRAAFVGGVLPLIAVWAAFDLLAPGFVQRWIGWLVGAALFYLGACVLSQRLHDRGRSGWWSGLILIAFAICWPQGSSWPEAPLDWLWAALLLAVVVDLAILPGQTTFNRYGAPQKSERGADQTGASAD